MSALDWMLASQILLLGVSIALSLDARRRTARVEKRLDSNEKIMREVDRLQKKPDSCQ